MYRSNLPPIGKIEDMDGQTVPSDDTIMDLEQNKAQQPRSPIVPSDAMKCHQKPNKSANYGAN